MKPDYIFKYIDEINGKTDGVFCDTGVKSVHSHDIVSIIEGIIHEHKIVNEQIRKSALSGLTMPKTRLGTVSKYI